MSLVAWWNRQRSLLCYPSEGKNFTCCLIRNDGHLCDPTPYRGICLCRGVLSDPIVVRGQTKPYHVLCKLLGWWFEEGVSCFYNKDEIDFVTNNIQFQWLIQGGL